MQVSLVSSVDTFFFFHCRICNTFNFGMCLNKSKTEDSSSNMKTHTPETETNISNVIIFVVYVFISIMIGIIGATSFCKRLGKNKGNFKIY